MLDFFKNRPNGEDYEGGSVPAGIAGAIVSVCRDWTGNLVFDMIYNRCARRQTHDEVEPAVSAIESVNDYLETHGRRLFRFFFTVPFALTALPGIIRSSLFLTHPVEELRNTQYMLELLMIGIVAEEACRKDLHITQQLAAAQ